MPAFNVYRNLNKPGYASVQQSGKVIDYAQELLLKDCGFHVSEKRRLKVISEKRKNVHAWIKGKQFEKGTFDVTNFEELLYDPYRTKHFIVVSTGKEIMKAAQVVYKDNKCYALGISYEK
ncbi:MAG: hypothetical protein COB67_02340 [SAR324 cluster bacterium]|uniref:Uncharacterized protein n=1 Tax=SAR324 cluster bacterium TaxID=2024889 RepID=A0A2A4T9V1_9DELT|nr:MAG: hypothetical protein COB67_02340 [SAR324 cluster bacterium]